MNPLQSRLAALRRRLRFVVVWRGLTGLAALLLSCSVLAGVLVVVVLVFGGGVGTGGAARQQAGHRQGAALEESPTGRVVFHVSSLA